MSVTRKKASLKKVSVEKKTSSEKGKLKKKLDTRKTKKVVESTVKKNTLKKEKLSTKKISSKVEKKKTGEKSVKKVAKVAVNSSVESKKSTSSAKEFDYSSRLKEVYGKLRVRWVDFSSKKDMSDIYSLREKVYCEEQGYDKPFIKSFLDKKGIHLSVYLEEKLIACISCGLWNYKNNNLVRWGIDKKYNLTKNDIIISFSKRAERIEYRGLRINEFITCYLCKTIFEELKPKLHVVVLAGMHKKLYPVYRYRYGFNHYKDFSDKEFSKDLDEYGVYLFEPSKGLRFYYSQKKKVEYIKDRYGIKVEQFSDFLEKNKRIDLLKYVKRSISNEENVYVGPLDIQAEFPRLNAQAKMLYMTQESVVEKFSKHFPKSKNGRRKFLDIGCAAGTYLSYLRKSPVFKDYSFSGLDNCEILLRQAKVFYPKVDWFQNSIYEMSKIEDNTFDVVHASLVFIHLVTPMIAVKEIFRILKPGGHLYVVDIVDKTFEGLKQFKRVIDKHDNVIRSDRNIMMYLSDICSTYGLILKDQVVSSVTNKGLDSHPKFDEEKRNLNLGKNIFWGMFSFIGHRREIAFDYQKAESEYFSLAKTDCKVDIYSQIFKKK